MFCISSECMESHSHISSSPDRTVNIFFSSRYGLFSGGGGGGGGDGDGDDGGKGIRMEEDITLPSGYFYRCPPRALAILASHATLCRRQRPPPATAAAAVRDESYDAVGSRRNACFAGRPASSSRKGHSLIVLLQFFSARPHRRRLERRWLWIRRRRRCRRRRYWKKGAV